MDFNYRPALDTSAAHDTDAAHDTSTACSEWPKINLVLKIYRVAPILVKFLKISLFQHLLHR